MVCRGGQHAADVRVIVPIMTLCIVSYLDRTAISFAIAGGMSKELAMSASFTGFAAGIFFIGYLVLQVPGGHLASRGVAKKFLTWSMVAWGVISIATAFATSQAQLIALRFVLGVAEGGMLPVVLTMISKWFPDRADGLAGRRLRRHRLRRTSSRRILGDFCRHHDNPAEYRAK
jgi:MFS family permease